MKLTKSLFLSYLESPLHMWLSVHSDTPPKPPSLYDQHTMKQGYSVEKSAKEFLQRKVATQYPAGTTLSFEATLTDGNYESRIDALVHDTVNNTYDLYEIKSSTTIHTEHKYDVTFQYLVGKATLLINKVYLVRVNSDYQRTGEIDINELFIVEDMTDHIAKKEDEVYQLRSEAWGVMRLVQEPSDEHCFNPGTCIYPDHCFPNLPDGSIYELGRASKKQYRELLDMGVELVKDIPDTFTSNYKQRLQIQSARQNRPIIGHDAIAEELSRLEYPIYFLDYETYGEALPMYNGYKPYQQAVTQFSIHVARQPDSDEFEHYECLATEVGDPARHLATELCNIIGDTGSVIVWNKGFECGRNDELAVLCPDLDPRLKSINERPIGYTNVLKANRISTVEQDLQRAPTIKEIFEKVAYQGYSGRMVKKWLDDIDFRTKSGCRMPLSKVYVALQNPFYYGEFQYGDKWYKGTHKPLISKTLFEKVQIQLQVAPKQWNKQLFPFKKICKCGSCGGSVTAEIKYRRTKANQVNTHIYYHCNRIKKYDCKEPYITEQELIKQLIGHLPEIKLNTKYLMAEFETEVKRLQHLKATVIDKFTPRFELTQHNTGAENTDEILSSQTEIIREYLLHVLQYGTPEERLKILGGVKSKFELKDRKIELL